QPQGPARHVCERRGLLGKQREAEMCGVPRNRGLDIVDHVPDIDRICHAASDYERVRGCCRCAITNTGKDANCTVIAKIMSAIRDCSYSNPVTMLPTSQPTP